MSKRKSEELEQAVNGVMDPGSASIVTKYAKREIPEAKTFVENICRAEYDRVEGLILDAFDAAEKKKQSKLSVQVGVLSDDVQKWVQRELKRKGWSSSMEYSTATATRSCLCVWPAYKLTDPEGMYK